MRSQRTKFYRVQIFIALAAYALMIDSTPAAITNSISDGVVVSIPSVNELTNGPKDIGMAEGLGIVWYKTPPPTPIDPNDPADSRQECLGSESAWSSECLPAKPFPVSVV